ncbi:MAG: fibronectin type III domain-containing protein [Chloroflexi bacterium]|nr:fibronectin type III domain-containing protein [Chloroflexota bacterium]
MMLCTASWFVAVRRMLVCGLTLGVLFGAPEVLAREGEPPGPARASATSSSDREPMHIVGRSMTSDWACDHNPYCVILPMLSRRVAPYAPTLNTITAPDSLGHYTLSWSYSHPDVPANTYTVQGSPHGDFALSTALYNPGSVTTWPTRSVIPGVYYYRVRANNEWGAGAWSNTQSVRVYSLFDEFDNPATGWTVRRTSSPYLERATAIYQGGVLQTGLNDRFDFAIFSPMYEAPPAPYRLQLKSRILHQGNELSYGMVFGGPTSTACPIDRFSAGHPSGCFGHYYRLNVVFGGYFKFQVKSIDYHDVEKGSGQGAELISWQNVDNLTDKTGWNAWEIRVYPNGFAVYVNGVLVGWTDNTTYVHDPYYGIFLSTFEYNGATFEHDYFIVEPLPTTAHLPVGGERIAGTEWYVPSTEPAAQP